MPVHRREPRRKDETEEAWQARLQAYTEQVRQAEQTLREAREQLMSTFGRADGAAE